MKKISAEEFRQIFGYDPENDDLERVNCEKAGTIGHMQCGWCPEHGVPRLKCFCLMDLCHGCPNAEGDCYPPTDVSRKEDCPWWIGWTAKRSSR